MKVQYIFITHIHTDHIASLPVIVLQNICDKIKTNIYCPAKSLHTHFYILQFS
jgi:ribonuclease BN (tRNA processing enzyme)